MTGNGRNGGPGISVAIDKENTARSSVVSAKVVVLPLNALDVERRRDALIKGVLAEQVFVLNGHQRREGASIGILTASPAKLVIKGSEDEKRNQLRKKKRIDGRGKNKNLKKMGIER